MTRPSLISALPSFTEMAESGKFETPRPHMLRELRGDAGVVHDAGTARIGTIVQAEFVQRCRSAGSKEVGPILFVHSRVLIPSRWSL